MSDAIELEQFAAEQCKERNVDEHKVHMKQKDVTGNLKQDFTKITTDITVAKSRITDLENRRAMLMD